MAELLPVGTVTFFFSDIEGSTRLMQLLGDGWGDALATHNRLLRDTFATAGGREVDRQGDAFFAVFARAREAVAAAVAAQRALNDEQWPAEVELRVRIGLHTGEPSVGDEGYLGLDVVRASRICALARGGEILASETTRALLRGDTTVELEDAGAHALKDIDEPERLFRVRAEGLPEVSPRPLAHPAAGRELAPFEGHADALADRAQRALAAAGVVRMEDLDQIGPRVEAGVDEMLRSMGVPRRPAERVDARRPPVSTSTLAWLLVAGLLVGVVVVTLFLDRL